MNTKIIGIRCGSAVLVAAAASVASAQQYYQTTNNFQSSNISANASSDFIDGLQFGTSPSPYNDTDAPSYSSNGVTLEGTYGNTGVLGLIDAGNGNGAFTTTDAILNFSFVAGSNATAGANVLFGMGELVDSNPTGADTGGALTSKPNNYPDYVVEYLNGALSLEEQQSYGSGFPTTITSVSASESSLNTTDKFQLEMITTPVTGTSATLSAILTDESTDTIIADLTAAGTLTDAEGSVGFFGGNSYTDPNETDGITATAFSVNAPVATPEPSVIGLVALVGSGLMLKRRRRAV
jgi:hypothetical protein